MQERPWSLTSEAEAVSRLSQEGVVRKTRAGRLRLHPCVGWT